MTRLLDLDDLMWELDADLSDMDVKYAGFGGPVAVCAKNSSSAGCEITLFNCLGGAPRNDVRIRLGNNERLHFMCWNTACDHLIIVLRSGLIRFYNVCGEMAKSAVTVQPPVLCAPTGNGVAVVVRKDKSSLAALSLIVVENAGDIAGEYSMTSLELPSAFVTQPPTHILAIPRQVSDTGYTELYVASSAPDATSTKGSCSVFHCVFHSTPRCYDLKVNMPGGDVQHMVLSPGASSIAILTRDGSLYVTNSSFEDVTCLFNIDTEVMPAQLMWCGEACITYLHLASQFDAEVEFPTTLTICNPRVPDESDLLNDLPQDAVLVQDCDGIRILSGDTYQFLQVVPDEGRRLFSVGSRASSALLVMAYDAFMSEDASAVKIIRDLQADEDALCEAIDDCVVMAGCEFDAEQQKRLLRIAAFGKSFCGVYDSDTFVNMTRRLRVLNALQKPPVGIVCSVAQFLAIEGTRLSDRLMKLGEYQLAYTICEALSLRSADVMTAWAMAKLGSRKSLSINAGTTSGPLDSEKAIADVIIDKMKGCPTASIADVAQAAYMRHMPRAALMLVEAEPKASDQIPMLLSIKQPEIALKRAIACGNPDLLFTVIAHLLGNRGTNAIPLLISDAVSCYMFISYALACDGRRELTTEVARIFPQYQTYQSLLNYFQDENRLKAKAGSNEEPVKSKNGVLRTQNSAQPQDWSMQLECAINSIQSATLAAKRENDTASSGTASSMAIPLPSPMSSLFATAPLGPQHRATSSYSSSTGGNGSTSSGGFGGVGSTGGAAGVGVGVNAAANAIAGVGTGMAMAGGLLVAGLANVGVGPTVNNEKYLKLHAALLDEQAKLARTTGDTRFLGASVTETIILCVEYEKGPVAETLRTKCGIAEKTYCWSLLRAYVANEQWDRIDKLAATACKKRAVISPTSLVNLLVDCGRPQQAKTYVPLISPIEQRMEFYLLCRDWFNAAADCKRNDEPGLLQQLRSRAKGDQDALSQLEEGWNAPPAQNAGGSLFSKFLSK